MDIPVEGYFLIFGPYSVCYMGWTTKPKIASELIAMECSWKPTISSQKRLHNSKAYSLINNSYLARIELLICLLCCLLHRSHSVSSSQLRLLEQVTFLAQNKAQIKPLCIILIKVDRAKQPYIQQQKEATSNG